MVTVGFTFTKIVGAVPLNGVPSESVPEIVPLLPVTFIDSVTLSLLHTVAEPLIDACGTGLTVMLIVIGLPPQVFAVGVMVKVTVTGSEVVLVNVPLMVPLPLATIPVTDAVLFLVQLYVVGLTLLLNDTGVIELPEQIL